jgi:hypothetical protein
MAATAAAVLVSLLLLLLDATAARIVKATCNGGYRGFETGTVRRRLPRCCSRCSC